MGRKKVRAKQSRGFANLTQLSLSWSFRGSAAGCEQGIVRRETLEEHAKNASAEEAGEAREGEEESGLRFGEENCDVLRRERRTSPARPGRRKRCYRLGFGTEILFHGQVHRRLAGAQPVDLGRSRRREKRAVRNDPEGISFSGRGQRVSQIIGAVDDFCPPFLLDIVVVGTEQMDMEKE